MKLNGWDILNADAKQWNVTPGFHSVKNSSEWNRGSPVMLDGEMGFKTIVVTLLIKRDGGRQALLSRCSEILSRLLIPVEIELDDFEHNFYGVMTKHSLTENPLNIMPVKYNRASKLTLTFDGYEYAKTESVQTFSGSTAFTVNNGGNIVTPAIVEITPQVGAASIEVTGICQDHNTGEDLPVVIRELATGKTVTLDGVAGLFTQEGKLKSGDIDIWERPALLPGENKITVDNNRMDITVKFHPRFM